MIEDIIAAAGTDKEDHTESTQYGTTEDFVPSIYGDTGTAADMAAKFGNMIMSTSNNKHEWPALVQAAFADLVMKHQDKGSTTTDQKFKGLNS